MERLIRVFKEVNIHNEKWELWLLGDGILKNQLENEVIDSGISKQVKFWGYQSSLETFYNQSHFYINSSYDEALGVSIIEAISVGLPVIGSNVGGVPEIIKPGINGFLVDFSNEESVVDTILKSININEVSYQEMSRACKSIFEEKFSIEKYAENLETEFSNLLN